MKKKAAYSVNDAARLFLESLADYQTATRDMNLGLQKLNGLLLDFSRPLKSIVVSSGSAIAPTRLERQAAAPTRNNSGAARRSRPRPTNGARETDPSNEKSPSNQYAGAFIWGEVRGLNP